MDAPLSKSAQKKAARAVRLAELKLLRRAKEKEAKREKKRIRAEKRAAGELDEDDAERHGQNKKARIIFGGKVVVDLGFDHLMSDKEVKSLSSQLAYTYSANRTASYPFTLLFTSLGGRVLERLESLNDAGYKRWSETEWWSEGYERLWASESLTPDTVPQTKGESSHVPIICSKESVVYLTADAEETLSELKPEETYIIGGIVDRNRHKNLCQHKAKEGGIRTARLPIGEYLASFPTRKVLTVNQVFEILVKWAETKDWKLALNHIMPKRKFNAEGRHGKSKVGQEPTEEEVGGSVTTGEEDDELKLKGSSENATAA